MKKIMDFIKKYPLLTAFAAFMLAVYVADMNATGREFSQLENRSLKQKPVFSWRSLVTNEYTLKYEEYINDQFVERDSWISIKSAAESAIGKIENNGVAYGGDNYMFGVKTEVDTSQQQRNTGYLNQFLESYDGHVTLGIIPNSYEMLPELLPTGMEYIQVKQQPNIDQIYRDVTGESVTRMDISGIMEQAATGGYYRTDHHWTTDSAYRVYAEYCRSRGLEAVELADIAHLRREEPGFYGTYYSKAKKMGAPADTLVWYDIPTLSVTINGNDYLPDANNNRIPITGLFQKEKLESRDKYAMFLYGNNGLTVIKSDNNLNKIPGRTSRLLLIKDSYSNCLVPFLTYSYDELYVVDLRGLGEKLSGLVAREDFDDLWVLYNWESFESDRNFVRMTF